MENDPKTGSIFNIGDLAKPVDTLIQRTSDFIGAALVPRQLIRMAKAKVESDRIEKLGNIETEIRERALQRLLAEEIRNQENIENIVRKALPEIKEDAKPEEISDDWLALFFEKSKRFSDEEMQNLWAKILGGEANKAGTFSKRTIEIVSTLEKGDAEAFTNLCSFNCFIDKFYPLIYFDQKDVSFYAKINFIGDLIYDGLFHLESIGLIMMDLGNQFYVYDLPEPFEVYYHENKITLDTRNSKITQLTVGNVMLTKSGQGLASICNSKEIEGLWEIVLARWKKNKIKFSVS